MTPLRHVLSALSVRDDVELATKCGQRRPKLGCARRYETEASCGSTALTTLTELGRRTGTDHIRYPRAKLGEQKVVAMNFAGSE
jgi:hypothetical protein